MAVNELQPAIAALATALADGSLPAQPARWELATGTPPHTVVAYTGQIPGQAWVLKGNAWLSPAPRLIHTAAGVSLVQAPGAFFQACAAWALEVFSELVAEWDLAGDVLYDLYGGGGLFSRLLAGRFRQFTLVESNALACADARINLAGQDVRIIERTIERWLNPGLGSPEDIIILDPPRAGLGRRLCATLAQSHAGRIVLCGCDGAAFCRDVGLLAPGWRLNRLTVLDLFPNTSQVECVGELLPAS